jgi:serine phosphatase RsbU (regulator of sigma subunit)
MERALESKGSPIHKTTERARSALDMSVLLEAVETAPPVAAAEVMGAALATALDAHDVSFLIADFSGRSLVRLSHTARAGNGGTLGRERGEVVAMSGSPHGRALREQDIEVRTDDGDVLVYAPVSSRGEAVGVLELRLGYDPDEDALETIAGAAHALAYVVIANRRFTDLFEWGQRSVPLSLEAEIQHRLLPGSYTCEGGQFTLAGWLEPAGDVGGDTFDFSLDRDTLHISLTDAMGHTLDAALLATVLVGALRNARRAGVSLIEQAESAQTALAAYTDSAGGFVTGQLVRVDLVSRTAWLVNAGHPPPIRIRNGVAEQIPLLADPPFGFPPIERYQVQALELEDGDRLVFVTDGLLERNASTVDVPSVLLAGRHLHPREAVQEVTRTIVEACGGTLADDATVLCFDWHGGAERDRNASAGADR